MTTGGISNRGWPGQDQVFLSDGHSRHGLAGAVAVGLPGTGTTEAGSTDVAATGAGHRRCVDLRRGNVAPEHVRSGASVVLLQSGTWVPPTTQTRAAWCARTNLPSRRRAGTT